MFSARISTRRIAGFAGFTICLAVAIDVSVSGRLMADSTSPDPNAAAITALQTYQLPNQTASARLPKNWTVVATGIGFIQAKGPNGELAFFGVTVPAHDGAQSAGSSSGITLPYSSDPSDEFLASINWIRARNGKPPVQAQFYSNTAVSAPPAFGKCSNLTAVLNSALAVETDFCSLPEDAAGNYRNFFKVVGLPAAQARQERSLMEAILASYRLNTEAIKRNSVSAPQVQASGSVSSTASAENSLIANQLMMQEANAINAQTMNGEIGMDRSVSNFDHGVIRGETPIYAQGMAQPMFWVGN